MKKILMTVCLVACLALVMAGSAQAASVIFTGSATLAAGSSASILVTTSTNVSMLYSGNANGQTYGAATKNKAGNKYYATGGGGTASSGIYYMQSDNFVGATDFSGADPTTMFQQSSGAWTAQ